MKHFVIPDCQIRPGDNLDFLTAIGNFIIAKKPDTIVCIGDFADMPSLSSYDVGKKSFEGKRYIKDVEATKEAMQALLNPLWMFNWNAVQTKHKQYKPRLVLTLGNHENRINRAVDNDAKLEGVLSIDDPNYETFGWEVFPFLEVVSIDGVAYSHYFTSGVLGRPCTSAQAQLTKKHQSCVAGHQQGLQIAMGNRADGTAITSIIAGSCYEHDEDYMGPQGNKHWRGCLMLHDVHEGSFNAVPVPLSFLKEKYVG
jgi:Calcineurin-like phosphoesterase